MQYQLEAWMIHQLRCGHLKKFSRLHQATKKHPLLVECTKCRATWLHGDSLNKVDDLNPVYALAG